MAATINQDTVGDKRYYDAENARLFKENAELKAANEALKVFISGQESENAELKRLVEQMTEALALANKEHPCPRKDYWQSVATTHHSGKCWHSKMEAALEAAKGATDMLAVIDKNAELKTLLDERTKDAKDEAINGLNMQKLFEREAEKNAELKKLVEQMTTALKEVRLYSCSHMQSTTHDTIDAALKAAKEQK